tara:strand:+ start:70 stop:495 length:426 start_codon:yes stop_codon:yes gene_type:complete
MKIKEYNEMMRYLTRPKEPTIKESKGAYDKFVAEGKNGYAPKKVKFEDTAIGKHVENTLYMYGETDKKPKHYDSELKKAQKSVKVKPVKVTNNKPVQLEFNFLDNITTAYEPVPTPPAAAPRDKDLDKGIASILGVKVRNA